MADSRWPTILFDLDGTLADTIPLIIASYQHAFREILGEEVSDARARAWIGRPLLEALLEESPERGHDLDRVYGSGTSRTPSDSSSPMTVSPRCSSRWTGQDGGARS